MSLKRSRQIDDRETCERTHTELIAPFQGSPRVGAHIDDYRAVRRDGQRGAGKPAECHAAIRRQRKRHALSFVSLGRTFDRSQNDGRERSAGDETGCRPADEPPGGATMIDWYGCGGRRESGRLVKKEERR